jgi:hypothetical protein
VSYNGGIFRVRDRVRLKKNKGVTGIVYDIQYCMVSNIVYYYVANGAAVSDYEHALEFDPLGAMAAL